MVYHHVVIDMPGGGTVTLNRELDLTCGLHLTKFFVNRESQPEPHDPTIRARQDTGLRLGPESERHP